MNNYKILPLFYLIKISLSIQLCPYTSCNSTRYRTHCCIVCSSPDGQFPKRGSSNFRTISNITFSNVSQMLPYSFKGLEISTMTIRGENLDSMSNRTFCQMGKLDSLNIINPKKLEIFFSNSAECLDKLVKNLYLKSSILDDSTATKLLGKIEVFKNLNSLNLSFNLIEYLPLENVNNLNRLEELILSKNQIDNFRKEALNKSKNLTFSLLPSLEVIDLSFNRIKFFEPAFNSNFLKKIILEKNFINQIPNLKRALDITRPLGLIVDLVSNNISKYNIEDVCSQMDFVNATFIIDRFFEDCLFRESRILHLDKKELCEKSIGKLQFITLDPLSCEKENYNKSCSDDSSNFEDYCLNLNSTLTSETISIWHNQTFNGSNLNLTEKMIESTAFFVVFLFN
ncbi:trophoblast glyco -like [Brachionus plicatilis]|uniref:Trophoblast glyco-like n=1 Tax=Brachionus plicatilis TaxID=10195 RepID=A0A3M7RC93_BRAPC|nr:trophoblast glyco -like [Brachionus plicatilis]